MCFPHFSQQFLVLDESQWESVSTLLRLSAVPMNLLDRTTRYNTVLRRGNDKFDNFCQNWEARRTVLGQGNVIFIQISSQLIQLLARRVYPKIPEERVPRTSAPAETVLSPQTLQEHKCNASQDTRTDMRAQKNCQFKRG